MGTDRYASTPYSHHRPLPGYSPSCMTSAVADAPAPKFSADGKVAVITVDSAFQIHPVIATRWAGNLGKKSKKLIMIMVCLCRTVGPAPVWIATLRVMVVVEA